ncbi:amidohydrolase family protein [Caballeronia sp. AZ7_KS35]|uniref:amidohydrolase family protein n=1 Tax=Caballeronia sp. AZ7_KS35 TaxID=2921762 RepID=UPI00202899E6|nr:amidohydrolase family protein [Caballeronia sp. AZ7_KS35]
MVSTDTHLSPPPKIFKERIADEFKDRLPRIEVRDGKKYIIVEGSRPSSIMEPTMEGEDLLRTKSGGAPITLDMSEWDKEKTGLPRIADQEMDGVDAEIIFPNGPALLLWSSPDARFAHAQAQIWNDWAIETCRPHLNRCKPVAALVPADLELTLAEIERVAKLGYNSVILPLRPTFGPIQPGQQGYNDAKFDPLWAALQDHGLSICYHVATGMDPRTASGAGGAIINYVVHANAPTMEPIVAMCASGVFERFPKLRAGTVEANGGWVPWMLDQMDEAYRKHHFWVRPKLKNMPSDYYRSNCFSTIAEDSAAMILCEPYNLGDNLMWANDYPHHEGTWPHSAEAIERTFLDRVDEATRAKILGLNAARVFGFEPPAL